MAWFCFLYCVLAISCNRTCRMARSRINKSALPFLVDTPPGWASVEAAAHPYPERVAIWFGDLGSNSHESRAAVIIVLKPKSGIANGSAENHSFIFLLSAVKGFAFTCNVKPCNVQ